MQAALLIEVPLTAGFLIVILGTTSKAAASGFAPIAIGLALTLIHLILIPVSNTSVNPARSTGIAFFAETAALPQLWLFWAAPLISALIWRFVLMPGEGVEAIGGEGRNKAQPTTRSPDRVYIDQTTTLVAIGGRLDRTAKNRALRSRILSLIFRRLRV